MLRFHVGQEILLQELRERLYGLSLANADYSLSQRGPMCRFHVAGDFVISLLSGFPHQLAAEHELVPVDIPAFIDAHSYLVFCCLRVVFFRGRPPFFPFSRELEAFLCELAEPRHAGQKQISSIP